MKISMVKIVTALVLVSATANISLIAGTGKKPATRKYGETVDACLSASAIMIRDNVLYMTFPSGSFRKKKVLATVDISNPAKPKLLNQVEVAGFPQGIAINGKTLWLVNGRELQSYDISSKKPVLTASLVIAENPLYGPQGIAVKGHYAWLACRRGGVKVVNIANPAKPTIAVSVPVPGLALNATISKNYLYLANGVMGMLVIDIGNPLKPAIAGQMRKSTGTTLNIVVNDKYAFLADGFHLLGIANIASPAKPRLLSSYPNRGALNFYGSYSYDLAYQNKAEMKKDFVYLADGESGVQVIDVSDPLKPKLVGALLKGMGFGSSYEIRALAIKGDYLYLNDDHYGLRVLKITNPSRPKILDSSIKLN